ncbi:MAG: hypothetical protein AB8B74_11090 [Crocinitomicaceae bacterium]
MKFKKVFFLCLLLFFFSCKKEQAELAQFNKNCANASAVSADFIMEELGGTINDYDLGRNSITDTVWSIGAVRFYALEDSAEYTWYIGSEIIHEREFFRDFGDEFSGQTFPMTLVVKKKPNAICNPNDDGYDSIVKNLTVIQQPNNSIWYDYFPQFEGTFRIKELHATDSIDINVQIRRFEFTDKPSWGSFYVQNLDQCAEIHGDISSTKTYRKLWLSNAIAYAYESCLPISGFHFYHRMDRVVELVIFMRESKEILYYYGRKL